MDVGRRTPVMTREQFFHWAVAQDLRHEFDGFQPVAMVGGTIGHNKIAMNIQFALRTRLQGTASSTLGSDTGVATIGNAVRYPDARVTCATLSDEARLVPGVVVVFEVVSPTSERTDRIIKVREYHDVPSIRRYVIVERTCAGLTELHRAASAAA